MMKETDYRIGKVTMFFMLIVALIFDLTGGLGGKLFHIVGAVAAAAVGWIPLFGSLLGGFALGAGVIIGEMFGWVVLIFAYLTFYVWFMLHHTPILSGKNAGKRFAIFSAVAIVEMTWFVNIAPAFTFWVWSMIMLSRSEDREAFDAKIKTVAPWMKRHRRIRERMRADAQTPVAADAEGSAQMPPAANDNRLRYEEQIAA